MGARFVVVLLVLLVGAVVTAPAQTQTVYNSVPKPLPGNVASEGPEAYAFAELGDAIQFPGGISTGTLGQVTVVMSSWACQSGNWFSGNCVTASGATFPQALTFTIYSTKSDQPPTKGTFLGSITQTFNLPYRPSSTPAQCGGDNGAWYSSKEKTCYHGLAVPVTVNFSNSKIPIPPNGQIILTVSFNTSHYGPYPLGEGTACYTTSAGCPYDSLNISTDTSDGTFATVGSALDPNGIMVNYTLPNLSCYNLGYPDATAITPGTLMDDTGAGCWLGYHPQFQVQANTNSTGKKKGSGL